MLFTAFKNVLKLKELLVVDGSPSSMLGMPQGLWSLMPCSPPRCFRRRPPGVAGRRPNGVCEILGPARV